MLLTDADELRAALRVALKERDAARAALHTAAEAQREACARHLCPKVPHSACADFHCEAGVVREAPLVAGGTRQW